MDKKNEQSKLDIMLIILLMTFGIFGTVVYTQTKQNQKIQELTKQRDAFVIKYSDEREKSDTLTTSICLTQFKDFKPTASHAWIYNSECVNFINKQLQETKSAINENQNAEIIKFLRDRNINVH